MGNQPSVSEEVTSSLSPNAQKKLQFLQTFMETATKTSTAPRNMPSLKGTWHETSHPASRTVTTVVQQQPSSPPSTCTSGDPSPVTTTRTVVTERRPSGNPSAPYYVVSTTTYYVHAPPSPTGTSSSSSSKLKSIEKKNAVTYETINKRKFVCIPGMQYRFMCDDEESDRLIIQHFLLKYSLHGNFTAPVQDILVNQTLCTEENPRPQVLDVGCGPGTWVLEMATDFSNADFHGIDAHPAFPDTIKPGNAHFCQHNVLAGLPYEDATFDYVHVRLLLSTMTHPQAVYIIAEVTRVLKPNGYVELCDVEYRVQRPGPLTNAHVNEKVYNVFESSYQINLNSSHNLSTLLLVPRARSLSGYVDVYQEQATLPLAWGDQLGQLHGQNFHALLSSVDPHVREKAELTDLAIDQIVQECEKHQSHLRWFSCYGRKQDLSLPPSPTFSAGSVYQESAWEAITDFADGYVD